MTKRQYYFSGLLSVILLLTSQLVWAVQQPKITKVIVDFDTEMVHIFGKHFDARRRLTVKLTDFGDITSNCTSNFQSNALVRFLLYRTTF